jgi:glutathione S-transferase
MTSEPVKTAGGDYTLFWEAMSGAMAVEFVLEEAGLPYRLRPVDMAAGEHLSDAYRTINPTGQVPALGLPDGRVIGESAAIILTLGERHPETGMVPMPSADERPAFLRWLIYMAASPYMTFVQFNHPERFVDDHVAHAALIENARTRLTHQFGLIDAAITGAPFFLKSGLSALDFYVFMLVSFFSERERLLSGRPNLDRLVQGVANRKSVQRVLPRHGL